MTYLVDTGILLQIINRNDPSHELVRNVLGNLNRSGAGLRTSAQNIAECWNVCTRPRSARGGQGFSTQATVRKIRLIQAMFPLYFETAESFALWKKEVEEHDVKGAKIHDARLVGIMKANGIRHILTLNVGDFARYSNISAVTPQSVLV